MKIYAASKEDILRRQRENENWYQESNARYESQTEEYGKANKAQMDKFEQAIYDRIGNFVEPLELRIYVDNDYYGQYGSSGPSPYYSVHVNCHNRDLFKTDQSLSWDYRVTLDADGNVVKESGCCTNLKATNDVQIQDLKLSVECLEILNNIDWKSLMVSIFPPNRSDYVTENDPNYEYRQTKEMLDAEMLEADIDELIGTNKVVLWEGEYNDFYAKIYKDTGKQYEIGEINHRYVDSGEYSKESILKGLYVHRVSKKKFLPELAKPLKIVDLDKLS